MSIQFDVWFVVVVGTLVMVFFAGESWVLGAHQQAARINGRNNASLNGLPQAKKNTGICLKTR